MFIQVMILDEAFFLLSNFVYYVLMIESFRFKFNLKFNVLNYNISRCRIIKDQKFFQLSVSSCSARKVHFL